MKRIGISQSNYIPWKGYFDFIELVDQFVLYDDVQYTRRDWRNRNLIKTPSGTIWLTIPVKVKGRYHQSVYETEVADRSWAERHWETLCMSYSKTSGFEKLSGPLADMFREAAQLQRLSEVNLLFIQEINSILGIETELLWSRKFNLAEGRTERLIGICRDLGATHYLCGPTAKGYLDETKFRNAGIVLEWMDYSGYPTYPQPHGAFDHRVSILDLLFCTGTSATRFMKSFGRLLT